MTSYQVAYNKNGLGWAKGKAEDILYYSGGHDPNMKGSVVYWDAEGGETLILAAPPVSGGGDWIFTYEYFIGKVSGDKLAWRLYTMDTLLVTTGKGAGLAVYKGEVWAFYGDILDGDPNSPSHQMWFRVLNTSKSAAIHDWGSGSTGKMGFGQPCAISYQGSLWVFVNDRMNASISYFVWNGAGDPAVKSNWVYYSFPDEKSYSPLSVDAFCDRLYVAYLDKAGNAGWLRSYQAGNWSRPVKFTENIAGAPSLVVFRGLLHIVYVGQDFKMLCRTFDGSSYGPEILVSEEGPLGGAPICAEHPGLNSIVALYPPTDVSPPVQFKAVALYPEKV